CAHSKSERRDVPCGRLAERPWHEVMSPLLLIVRWLYAPLQILIALFRKILSCERNDKQSGRQVAGEITK
ncbi:MAG TPA: hypothetical protein VGN31_10345, partial [Paraburkholderia sp.]